jgi:hypothetical protein
MIGRENRSTRRKPAQMPLCPPQTPSCCPDANPGRRGWKPATNRLSYGTSSLQHFVLRNLIPKPDSRTRTLIFSVGVFSFYRSERLNLVDFKSIIIIFINCIGNVPP